VAGDAPDLAADGGRLGGPIEAPLRPEAPASSRDLRSGRLLLAIAGLPLLAAALRLWQLGSIPPGFHVDEAFNVLDARSILHDGWRPIFLPDNAGREVLYTYLQVALMSMLGD